MFQPNSNSSSGTTVKVLILGSTDVGKTCLATQYVQSKFLERTSNTIGACFLAKNLTIQGRDLSLQLWDTAGHERFRSMLPLYYRGAHAAILVYDVSSQKSFQDLTAWVTELRKHLSLDMVLSVACNKVDLPVESHAIDDGAAKAFAESIGASFFRTSAKTNEGVALLFKDVAERICQTMPETFANTNNQRDVANIATRKNTQGRDKQAGGCC